MPVELIGSVKGEKEIRQMYAAAPHVYFRFMLAGFQDERARIVGGPNSKGKNLKGFKGILTGKKRKGREGTWAPQIAGLFKGYIKGQTVGSLKAVMGAGLGSRNQMTKALEMLQTGGTITSGKMMPVPVYKNLAAIGVSKGFHKAKAFKRLARQERFDVVKKGNKTYFFDKLKRLPSGEGHSDDALLFVGTHTIRVGRALKGRYDFLARFDRMLPAIGNRLQRVVDRATVAAQKGRD